MLFMCAAVALWRGTGALSMSRWHSVGDLSCVDGRDGSSQVVSAPHEGQPMGGLKEVMTSWQMQAGYDAKPNFGIMTVGTQFQEHLHELATKAYESLGRPTTLVSVVGSGVIGGGREREDEPCIALLAGVLPRGTMAKFFTYVFFLFFLLFFF